MTNRGQFVKGCIPWNKGLKGYEPSPDTEFKKGESCGNRHPCWKGGVQKINNDVIYLWDGCNKRVRRSRKVYEEVYGEIPKGYVVYHLNGCSWDDRPNNLEAISRKELYKRNGIKGHRRKNEL